MNTEHKNSLRKDDYKIAICEFSDIRHIFSEYHYKKDAIGGGISYCFALLHKGNIAGGAITGLPRHISKYPNSIDIRRMACLDASPKNSESFFIGRIIQFVASNTDFDKVLSYSDKTVGHVGTIYKASNFVCVGETAKSKTVVWNGKQYHPRSLTIDREYSYRLREAVKNKEAEIITGDKKRYGYMKFQKNKKEEFLKLAIFKRQ